MIFLSCYTCSHLLCSIRKLIQVYFSICSLRRKGSRISYPEAFFTQNTECQTAKACLQEIHRTPNNASSYTQTLNRGNNAVEFVIGKKRSIQWNAEYFSMKRQVIMSETRSVLWVITCTLPSSYYFLRNWPLCVFFSSQSHVPQYSPVGSRSGFFSWWCSRSPQQSGTLCI